jgi:uncharacterized membrane protein
MGWYQWLLFLHVAAAFATVAAVVLFGALLVTTRRDGGDAVFSLGRVSSVASRLWNIGGGAVLLFGVWLTIYLDGYDLLDGWIVAALGLYIVASAAGGLVHQAYLKAVRSGRLREWLRYHCAPRGSGVGGVSGLLRVDRRPPRRHDL